MAEIYGVAEANVLPVRGPLHGIELVMRAIALDGADSIAAPADPDIDQLAKLVRIARLDAPRAGTGAVIGADANILRLADERYAEYRDTPSLAPQAAQSDDLIVLRSLEPYGLTDAPCGALIASPARIAALENVLEPGAISPALALAALAALAPARVFAARRRFAEVKEERARMAGALPNAQAEEGPFVLVRPDDIDAALRELASLGVRTERLGDRLRIGVADRAANDRALAAFGVGAAGAPLRRGKSIRETLETKIVAEIDLDREGASTIETGVGFFDHMLHQIAAHGGFSLALYCEGDLEIDAHHTIEDCALALGAALKEALGARRGIARFGFVLPMDEAEAKVSIDLGGRPYCVFEGAFKATHIGAYPTQMTEHVFRSLAQSMGAAIHVAVTGENDHHTTEACFKAFGRALRQAVRIEGEAIASTKGVIA